MNREVRRLAVVVLLFVVLAAANSSFSITGSTEPPDPPTDRPWLTTADHVVLVAWHTEALAVEAATRAAEEAERVRVEQEAEDARLAEEAAELARQAAARARAAPRVAPVAPSGNVWDALAQCEAGGNWSINTGNGFSGGLQIVGDAAGAMSKEDQIAWAEVILSRQGWGAWPACSSILGLR